MTDEELDRDWQPNGRRPQSTIARSFSQELMDIFRIDNSVADLDEKVDKRRQQVTTQATELEALEARIREMEARMKGGPANSQAGAKPGPASPRAQRAPVGSAFDGATTEEKDRPKTGTDSKHSGSRPGTARPGQQAVPGALPPTPVASEGQPLQQHRSLPEADADFVFVQKDGDGEHES